MPIRILISVVFNNFYYDSPLYSSNAFYIGLQCSTFIVMQKEGREFLL